MLLLDAGISITSLYWRFEDKMDNEPNDSLYVCTHVKIYIHTYAHSYSVTAEGAKNNNCERTHYAVSWGVKCLTRTRMQITRTTRRGRKWIHMHPKRVAFFPFLFYFTYLKNKTEHLYCACLRIQSDTLTRGYRISYYIHTYYVCIILYIIHTYSGSIC